MVLLHQFICEYCIAVNAFIHADSLFTEVDLRGAESRVGHDLFSGVHVHLCIEKINLLIPPIV